MKTPCVESQTLSAITGCTLFLKFENLQFTASFKERGALNKLLTLDAETLRRGVCAMSAGNHAQGVAYHANRLGAPATIVMPKGTPANKISRTRDHGAQVIVGGANLSEAFAIARAAAESENLTFIHPFDDPAVIAGQGTLAEEILAAVPDLDILVVPIGGGGLISGIAIAAKQLKPGIRIIGVQSHTYPSMVQALEGIEMPCGDGMTIAEGIAVKTAGTLTRSIVRDLVDDILLVEETSIEQAVALLLSVEKTVAEGAGAAGLAAILEHPDKFAGLRVATILSGGNIDLRILASVAMRALVRSGQLLRVDVSISDQPGALSTLATILGDEGANIVDIAHDRLSLTTNPKGAVLGIVMEVQDRAHGDAVLEALRARCFAAVPAPL
ncbi:MAG: threonine dehydratase [Bradyrhizobium sp.]|nr:threonine dehydratase [Bradyrhizobium sp.]